MSRSLERFVKALYCEEKIRKSIPIQRSSIHEASISEMIPQDRKVPQIIMEQ
ncbi:MAG: hypothetical protein K9W44_04610 [Candidatus Lokiarchaeota archaeon]|nr:hypothetical protein [Candidatus Harpocratesius repetitus]